MEEENEVRQCTQDDRCPDMVRQITWGKASRYYMGGGLFILVVASVVSIIFDFRSDKTLTRMEATVALFVEKVEAIETRVGRLSYDQQRDRVYMNKLGKVNGIDPIEVRPFNPPTYEDMVREYINKQEKVK